MSRETQTFTQMKKNLFSIFSYKSIFNFKIHEIIWRRRIYNGSGGKKSENLQFKTLAISLR
jgi:hypothetical protein